MIWMPGQSVGFVKSTGFVDNCKVKLEEEERPTGLMVGEFLFGMEVDKIIVIGLNLEWQWVPFEVVAKGFKSTDDSKVLWMDFLYQL